MSRSNGNMANVLSSLLLEDNVMKYSIIKSTIAMCGCMFATGAIAGPLVLNTAQMDSVAAGGVERVEGFVCPVLTTDAVFRDGEGPGGPLGIEGYYTIPGPDVMVPVHATNGSGDGSNPGGPFNTPGDLSYTAIWAR
jgi:hypothetical protein